MTEVQKNEQEQKKEEAKEVEEVEAEVTSTEIESLKNELEEKTKLADDYLSQLKYLQADFENYKKKSAKTASVAA